MTQTSLPSIRLSHHSCLPSNYYYHMLQYFPSTPKAFASHHQITSVIAWSPSFPPSQCHSALHHISCLSEAQHFHNLTPSCHSLTAESSEAKPRSTARCFPSHTPKYSLPAKCHLPANSHCSTLNHTSHSSAGCSHPFGCWASSPAGRQ